MRKYYIFIVILGLVVTAALLAGFITGGNPSDLKAITNDANTVNSFSSIESSIYSYYDRNSKLPTTLNDLALPEQSLKNSSTQKPFVYNKIDSVNYTLCSDFATNAAEVAKKYGMSNYGMGQDSNHKKGYDCLQYHVTPKVTEITPTVQPTATTAVDENVLVQYFDKNNVASYGGLITTPDNLLIRIGPDAKLKEVAEISSYYLLVIHIDLVCTNIDKNNCPFFLNYIDLKTKDGSMLTKNLMGQTLYTPYISENLGELLPIYNITPNTAASGYVGFYVPTNMLPLNTPTDFYMSYSGVAESAKLTVTSK